MITKALLVSTIIFLIALMDQSKLGITIMDPENELLLPNNSDDDQPIYLNFENIFDSFLNDPLNNMIEIYNGDNSRVFRHKDNGDIYKYVANDKELFPKLLSIKNKFELLSSETQKQVYKIKEISQNKKIIKVLMEYSGNNIMDLTNSSKEIDKTLYFISKKILPLYKALKELHRNEIFHLDFSPWNICLKENNDYLTVIDFDMSELKVKSNIIKSGTSEYFSPFDFKYIKNKEATNLEVRDEISFF